MFLGLDTLLFHFYYFIIKKFILLYIHYIKRDLSFFKKILGKLFQQQEETEEQPNIVKLGDELKNADIDYKFAQLFSHSGGFFNYCADESEALKILNQIITVEEISSIFCFDEDLKNFLNVLKTPFTEDLVLSNDTAFITCEYLIAHNGSIMLSQNNIKHYHSSRLPDKVIIMANVSQIVGNLSDAMMKIKRRGSLKNLTSISGNQSSLDNPSKINNKLFLLLLED